jgi:hypothetical protein
LENVFRETEELIAILAKNIETANKNLAVKKSEKLA